MLECGENSDDEPTVAVALADIADAEPVDWSNWPKFSADAARDELASEMAACASYYALGAALAENSGHEGTAAKMGPVIGSLMEASAKLSSQKKALARLELARQEQVKTYKEESFARVELQYAEL